ncbi:cytochrome b [Acidihalobacter ferrooxydans]|uniref:Cytochrome b561 bacterial/Ni-hydrogenase domain-containing protein n=1 Tax=Acidihalobacter ferrooxydans TaxID=1765967 RepID=A0A1P8UKT1_9GAMM|nr:cytochrome b/b6 domain-containing protein [Acidihalobacter ferrooxydans]APZ44415.1 hypothetical protein BW247_16040 [Acidihalobacter ferrooxydans]
MHTSRVGRILHWFIALLVLFQGLLGYSMLHVGWFREHLTTEILIHQQMGLLIFGLSLWMLSIRLFKKARSGNGLNALNARLAEAVHVLLYGLIFIQSAVGIWMMGLLGKGLWFFAWHVALPIHPNPVLVFREVLPIHAAIAESLAGIIMLHTVAALYHHFVLHDDVLRRMSPVNSSDKF